MEILDDAKRELRNVQQLAKKYLDPGEVSKAVNQYMTCARLSKTISKLSSVDTDKNHYLQQSKEFEKFASDLKENKIKISTDGSKPSESRSLKPAHPNDDKNSEKVKDLILVEKPKIKFEDIAGLENVKERIKEVIVYPFEHPEEYEYYKVSRGGGILLYGPPGCGKTMIAAAAAAECNAVFISLKISDIKDKYVGESEKKIKEIFNLAREHERAIVFFDEIDAIASNRSDSSEGYEKSLVNELLAQMDGVDTKSSNQYLLLAATNIPWTIDTALRRPGRFDKSVFIPQPDLEARKKLFEIYLRNRPVSSTVKIEELASMTRGYASSEISFICEEAARIPLKEALSGRKRREISMNDLKQVISETQTILVSWYSKALKEVKISGEEETFAELIRAGKSYE
jgi:transitional endoplasmic reticulum ATPase